MSRNATELMGTPDELFHWIPGEMIIVIQLPQRPAENTQDLLVEQVRNQLNSFLAPYKFVLELYGTFGRWNDIPTMPPIRRRSFLFGLRRQQPLLALFFHTRSLEPDNEDDMPVVLSYIHAHLERLAQDGLQIVSAMPNWLVTAAPVLYGNGGPALPPRPAPLFDTLSSTMGQDQIGWHLLSTDPALPLDPQGAEDVLIAVLDTAHHPDRVRGAAIRPEFRRNWLLQRLTSDLKSGNGLFEIAYNRYPVTNDVRSGRDASYGPRYYFMPDHGVFVSGIIRDIAPNARIRLIRILNDFGGCDLYNLFAALTDLEHELVSGTIRRLIINLSITTLPDARHLPSVWFDDQHWHSTQLSGIARILVQLEEGLRLLFESLFAAGALIVAAAGNDSVTAHQQGQPSHSPRPPRAPARFDSVLSVTSVNGRFFPSIFANAAGLPAGKGGVATFGGDRSTLMDVDGLLLPDAVRGLYISPTFPEGQQNTTGWADWCGSSFATAIISALGAHLFAQRGTAPQIRTRLTSSSLPQSENLFGTAPTVPRLLANLVRIQQRFEH